MKIKKPQILYILLQRFLNYSQLPSASPLSLPSGFLALVQILPPQSLPLQWAGAVRGLLAPAGPAFENQYLMKSIPCFDTPAAALWR